MKTSSVSKDTGKKQGKDYQVGKNKPPVETQFKPGHKPSGGRPKGKLNYDTYVDLAIKQIAEEYIAKHNKDPKNKNKQIDPETFNPREHIFKQHIAKAMSGDFKSIESFLDRSYGKPKQSVELSGNKADPIQHEIKISEATKKLLEWQAKWGKNKK